MIAEPTPTLTQPPSPPEADRRRLGLLSLGHAVVDSYGNSFLAPLFPLLAERLSLTQAMVGSLVMVMGLSSSLGQPLLGYISDRRSRVCLVALGPAVAAIGCSLVSRMPDYGWLLVCLFLTGLGIGAFHPQGASLARQASGGSSLAMSAFTVGGSIGFGLAPLTAVLALRTLGLDHLHWIALPGLLLAVVMWRAFRCPGVAVPTPTPTRNQYPEGDSLSSRSRSRSRSTNPNAQPLNTRPLALLTATVAVRAAVQVGTITFLPFYLVTHSLPGVSSGTARGLAVSAFLLANALGGPLGGHLSDRLGRKPVMLWSFLLAAPPLLLAYQLPGYWSLAALALGGCILALPHPSNVIMAQEMLPRSVGIAASLITGLAWGIAMLMALPLGIVADHLGAGVVLRGLALLPLLGAPLVLLIPVFEPRHKRYV